MDSQPLDPHEADSPSHQGRSPTLFDRSLRLMAFVAVGILMFVMLAITVDVVLRYFFGRPLGWTTEISEYSLLYITFLGAAWVLREDGHITVDLLPDLLSEHKRALLRVVTSVIGTAACLVLTVYGSIVTYDFFARNIRSITLLRFPMAFVHAAIPFGSLFLTIEFARRTWHSLTRWRDGKGDSWNGGSYSY